MFYRGLITSFYSKNTNIILMINNMVKSVIKPFQTMHGLVLHNKLNKTNEIVIFEN